MDWKKNDVFQVEIEDLSDTGQGIGKVDGFTWFIKDGVIGDLVEARVMKVKKTYGFARLLRVLEPSPCRVAPKCPVARQCGGCQLQAMSYEEQLKFKENKVFHNLVRIGGLKGLWREDQAGGKAAGQPAGQPAGIFYPIIGMEYPWRYRNKAQFPFGRDRDGRIITGFYAGRTHSIIEQEDCLLGIPENSRILACIRGYMEEFRIQPYDESSHKGLVRHALIRKGFRTGELMVCLVINGEVSRLAGREVLVERLRGLFAGTDGGEMDAGGGAEGKTAGPRADGKVAGVRAEGDVVGFGSAGHVAGEAAGETARGEAFSGSRVVSISCSINRERTNVIMGREIVNLYGPGYITDYIGNVCYRISPLSFYQVNPVQTERLYATALEYAGLTGGETVWDLYCGIGTISLFLAQKAGKVYGVELVPQAIADARANARLNGIQNVEFFVGKAEEVLPEQFENHGIRADVVVVDPPRKGCDQVCLDTIIHMAPRRVVYVSCDSATLARDLKYLGEGGYGVEKVQTVDMFGQGVHVETVCLLSNRKPDTKVRVDVDLEDYYRIKDAEKNQN